MENELQALNNAASSVGLVVFPKMQEDKRKTVQMYFATYNGRSISPVLPYDSLNVFLLGCIKTYELHQKTLATVKQGIESAFNDYANGKEVDFKKIIGAALETILPLIKK